MAPLFMLKGANGVPYDPFSIQGADHWYTDDPGGRSGAADLHRSDIPRQRGHHRTRSDREGQTRCYASAADLSADIRRYLNDEPIAARPPSAGHQLLKFTRHHRGLTAGAAAVFAVVIAGIAASTSQAIRASRAELESRRGGDRAKGRGEGG
jgi:hypothetical protein